MKRSQQQSKILIIAPGGLRSFIRDHGTPGAVFLCGVLDG